MAVSLNQRFTKKLITISFESREIFSAFCYNSKVSGNKEYILGRLVYNYNKLYYNSNRDKSESF
ncbi:hypothetical protein Bmyc01_10030 [Bacillus mycoides]|nr:hypothetical protein BC2926_01380 [Bacillus cereus]GLV62333.1 hypothetical protein Bmyc01_10030 [Bacillus mycoides]